MLALPPVLTTRARITVMIGGTFCAKAYAYLEEGKWWADPTRVARKAIKTHDNLLPWRLLTPEDEGVFWVRGWSKHRADALCVAAALTMTRLSA